MFRPVTTVPAAALTIALAACGARGAPAAPATPTAQGTGVAAGRAPACQRPAIVLGHGPVVSPMTGEDGDFFTLTNRGSTRCALTGYPRVTLLGPGGTQLPFHYQSGGGSYVTPAAPTRVVLAPGAAGYVLVAKYRCDQGEAQQADTIQLSMPGWQGGALTATAHGSLGVSELWYCRGARSGPGQLVAVSPVEPSAAAAASLNASAAP